MNTVSFKKRNLWWMLFWTILTVGLYFFFWIYVTKEEINQKGGTIPTIVFAFLPFFNIYFDYRYAQNYVKIVRNQEQDISLVILYFIVILVLPIIAPFVLQNELNKL
ncbi:MAG: DUF4234 domain-containing protein [Candidatus Dependentiae bacterium]|nr:DUF4234 domain-containing protein [Candidatus Dependentiae bacterium]